MAKTMNATLKEIAIILDKKKKKIQKRGSKRSKLLKCKWPLSHEIPPQASVKKMVCKKSLCQFLNQHANIEGHIY
jgi:hypothetical protein